MTTTVTVSASPSENLPLLRETPPYEDQGIIATVVNQHTQGRTNASGTFTLAANADQTKVTDPAFNGMQYIKLIPLSANAAAALATSYQDTTQSLQGYFVIVHTNNAQTDRNFAYERCG